MRIAAVVLIAALCFSTIGLQAVSGSSHGCAPLTPPPVQGCAGLASPMPGIILLNEVLLNPNSTWNCSESGIFTSTSDSWVELYNPQSQPLNLFASHATLDSGPGTNAYYFPLNTAIPAYGFLVLFPRTSSTFLATETAILRLLIAGTIVDQIIVPNESQDQSYARVPNGASNWQLSDTPTIDASNIPSQAQATPITTSQGTGGTTNGQSAQPFPSGTQPVWRNLHPPTDQATSDLQTSPSVLALSPTPSASNTNADTPRRIIVTLLIIALGLTLLWCWRLFTPSSP